MKSIVENIIAGIIVTGLTVLFAWILSKLGLGGTETAALTLFFLVVLALLSWKYYRAVTGWLAFFLLSVTLSNADEVSQNTTKRIAKLIPQERIFDQKRRTSTACVYLNQEVCEAEIRDAFRNARRVRILTIRGAKYFLSPKSIFHDLLPSRTVRGLPIEILILSPDSNHITHELALELGHSSPEVIREDMNISLSNLKSLTSHSKSFLVKCYDETPCWKILIFDDIMFISPFITAKNDQNAQMLQISREEDLFKGFEKVFEEMWRNGRSPW